jgi:hypothetical protein
MPRDSWTPRASRVGTSVAVFATAALWALTVAASSPARAVGASGVPCRSQRDACVDRLLVEMRRGVDRLGCEHNAVFALLYWRTTEGIRDALRAGEFSDRRYWNQVTTAFGRYYLDAFAAWRHGRRRDAPGAWRIAFDAARDERVSTLGDLMLGINAHVNRDLAFVYYRLRTRSHRDHLVVNEVLRRVQPVVFPELMSGYDPTLAGQRSADPNLSLDIFSWRELAWRNARRLTHARSMAARRAIAAGIERHAITMARRIRAAFPTPPADAAARDSFCDQHRPRAIPER